MYMKLTQLETLFILTAVHAANKQVKFDVRIHFPRQKQSITNTV